MGNVRADETDRLIAEAISALQKAATHRGFDRGDEAARAARALLIRDIAAQMASPDPVPPSSGAQVAACPHCGKPIKLAST